MEIRYPKTAFWEQYRARFNTCITGGAIGMLAPRLTPFWKEQYLLVDAALCQAFHDPAIRPGLDYLVSLVSRRLGVPSGLSPHLTTQMQALERECEQRFGPAAKNPAMMLRLLVWILRRQAPALDHAFGPALLWLVVEWVYDRLTEGQDAHPVPQIRLLPDNPIVRTLDGGYHHLERATSAHRKQLEAYLQSLELPAPRGRPAGSAIIPSAEAHAFAAKVVAAYQQLARRGDPPRQIAVAAALGMTERTFQRHRQRYGLPWPPA